MIDPSTVERIFEAAQIVEVVGEFVPLKKKGVNYMGNCPFHKEKTPSFVVSPARNIFKCFGCGKGGNAVHFIMEHEQMTYVEALKFLARKYHIEIQEREQTPQQVQQQSDRESMMIVTAYAQRIFSGDLFDHPQGKAVGLTYFVERGFREETIRQFELGYCLEERDAFTKRALAEGFKEEFLVSTGLSIRNERGLFDRFRGRVIFPIHNLSGKVIAFGGRILKTDKQTAKYLNSPESELYHKSHILYGIFQARKAIVQEDRCYLVEGYTDVLSMHQAGVTNVVASSGTALTVEQIRLIRRFTRNVTILYDGDAAGIKASLRGIDLVLEEGMQVKVILLPPGEDPDSYAKSHSATELRDFLKTQEADFIRFKVQLLLQDAGKDPIMRARLINEILHSVAIIPDAIERSVYLRECSQMMDIQEDILNKECARLRARRHSVRLDPARGGQEGSGDASGEGGADGTDHIPGVADRDGAVDVPDFRPAPAVEPGTEQAEKELVRLMMTYGNQPFCPDPDRRDEQMSVNQFLVRELHADELTFSHPLYARVLQEVDAFVGKGGAVPEHHFVRHPDAALASLAATLLASPYTLSRIHARVQATVREEPDLLEDLVPLTLLAFKYHKVMLMIGEVLTEMRQLESSGSDAHLRELQGRYILLNDLKKQLGEKMGHRTIM